MKTLVGFLTSCCMGILSAQQPQFIMPIWFEDSIGNRDTVWVGGDPTASSQNLNPQFGEIALTSPFDSVFEVRAVHGDDTDWETSKITIEYNDAPGQCFLAPRTRIMIHSKYPPVKIYWDTTTLATNYPCNINTILTPDQFAFLLQNWYEARIIYCMMTRDSIEIENLFPIPPPDQLEHPFEVEGYGVKVLPGLWFAGFWDFPHCYTTLHVSDIDLQTQVAVSPNPAKAHSTLINYSGLAIRTVQINNLAGQTAYSCSAKGDSVQLPLEGLRPGFYFIQTIFSNGITVTKKIIKE